MTTTSTTINANKISLIKYQGVILACVSHPLYLFSFWWGIYGVLVPASLNSAATPDWSTYDGQIRINGYYGNYIYSEGTKIFFPTSTGFKIWNNINGGTNVGGNPASNVTLGQVAIPS